MSSSRPTHYAIIAGAGVLATGGLFGWNIDDIWSDAVPSIAATLLFLLGVSWRAHVALFAAIALTLLALPDHTESLNMAAAAIALLAGMNLRDDTLARRAIACAAVPLLLIALHQKFILFPALAQEMTGAIRARLESGRVFSAFMVPAQFSAYLAMIVPIALTLAMIDRRKYLARALVIFILIGFYLAGSFSGVAAATVAAVYLKGDRRIFLIFLPILIALFFLRGGEGLGPIVMRLETWKSALIGVSDAPLLGHGAGSFEILYPSRYIAFGGDEVLHPHSWPIKILFERGIVGFAVWTTLAASLFAPARDRSFRAAAGAFFVASLLDIADLSFTLRSLGLFFLGASLKR